jgi:hypothetical protein
VSSLRICPNNPCEGDNRQVVALPFLFALGKINGSDVPNHGSDVPNHDGGDDYDYGDDSLGCYCHLPHQ